MLSLLTGPACAQGPALNYVEHCMGCHMEDGAGSRRNNVPDMRDAVAHFTRIAEGRAFLVQVAGVSQAPISDADLAALLNWMLPAFSAATLPEDFEPYTAQEVERLRATRPADIDGVRRELATRLAGMGLEVPGYRDEY
ncbi:MAG: c-type cytochrome [Gammaproteobacteria bacterium]